MYDLVEIFESLQGEGRNMGRPCVFIRFAGCNLKCPWCDTDARKRFSASLDELLTELAQYKAKSVILTGGEPTIQKEMPELVAALKKNGYWIGVETNGTSAADWLGFVDYVACSPKAEFAEFYKSGRGITRGEAELAKQVARGVTASPLLPASFSSQSVSSIVCRASHTMVPSTPDDFSVVRSSSTVKSCRRQSSAIQPNSSSV